MVKIAFSGKFTSGKSTAAKIVKELCPETKILSFATKLKEIGEEMYGMVGKDRKLLINIGIKMREIDEDVWLNYVSNQFRNFEYIVIDDLRFPNEYNKLKSEGFVLVRLSINKETQLERIKELYPETWKDHVDKLDDYSETVLDNYEFDYTVESYDIKILTKTIQKIINK